MSDPAVRRWPTAAAALVAAVVCGLAAVIAWSDAHVTYALPNSVGHDVRDGGIVAAAVCAMGTVCSLGAALLAFRSPRWTRVCLIVSAAAVVFSLGALTFFEIGPSPDY